MDVLPVLASIGVLGAAAEAPPPSIKLKPKNIAIFFLLINI
jgi:hypothetical protein